MDLLGVVLIGMVTALSVSSLSGSAPSGVVSAILERFDVDSASPLDLAVYLAMAAAVILIAKSAVNVFLTRRILRFLANRQAMVSGQLAEGLLSWPLLRVQRRTSQETAYALTDGVNYATLVILGSATVAVTEASLLVVLSLGLFLISPVVTAFTMVFFACVALLIHRMLSSWAGRLAKRATSAEVSSYSSVQEALRTYREVTVSNRRRMYVQSFQRLRWEAASVQSDLQFMNLIPKYTYEIALVVGAGLLAATQLLTADTTAAISIIAVFLVAGSRIVPSMLRLQGAALTVRHAQGMAAPTFALADEIELDHRVQPTINDDQGDLIASVRAGFLGFDPCIRIRNVFLTYPGADTPAVHDVSCEVKTGQSLALVGATGAGKSTLADLLLGVLTPDSGTIQLGHVTPSEAARTWPGAIAYVPQEVVMANGTIRENVALGLPDDLIDDDLVWEALERAQLSSFLRSKRDGLDTLIGEHGVLLSGGQRQRLGFARALYTRPRLLVLDEATSALDAETEHAISETLQALTGNVTTVTIAHRLATIRHCDIVLFLEHGRVAAQGTFDEVRVISPSFNKQAQLLGL